MRLKLSTFLIGLSSNLLFAQNIIDTWIIAGQSNCEGYAITQNPIVGLSPSTTLFDIGRSDLNITHSNVKIFQGANEYNSIASSAGMIQAEKNAWHAMTAYEGVSFDWGTGVGSESGQRFGFELSFGFEMEQYLSQEIALIKFARGGTPIASSTTQLPDGSWLDFDPSDAGRFNQYDKLISTINNAVSSLPTGDTLKIKGILWMQGESDANSTNASLYEANLSEFVDSLRSDLKTIEVTSNGLLIPETYWYETLFFIGTIATPGVYGDTVRNAQETTAFLNPNIFIVDASNDLSFLTSDDWALNGVHYDTPSQVELGERFANQVITTTYLNVSVNELKKDSDIKIYPNPVLEELKLINVVKNYNYAIYSTKGERISVGEVSPSEARIAIEQLTAGMYILYLGNGNVMKFIKK